jgi:hypothetical protein
MAVGYKAGSYFKSGKNEDAALWFARAFQISPENRKQNFLNFYWSTNRVDASLQQAMMAKAADNKEKALIAALFGLHGLEYGLENMKLVYNLDPQSELLPMLTVREIKKIEEHYLSPKLSAQKGTGELFYETLPGSMPDELRHAKNVSAFFEQLASDKTLSQNNLFRMAAAYTAYITGDHEKANKIASGLFENQEGTAIKQQALLIGLLSSIAKATELNVATEAGLLPQLQSLYSIAEEDMEYRVFMRNLYAQVLAPKYFAQGDFHKTALCLGVANLQHMPELKEGDQYFGGIGIRGIDFVRDELSTIQAIQLHDFLESKKLTAYERFLTEKTSFNKDEVTDFIGTSYLRDHDWKHAIEWLGKLDKRELVIGFAFNQKTYAYDSVFVNPFHDYLNDWQRYDKPLSKPMDKLDLANKMVALQYQYDTISDKVQKGKLAYLLGSAYYNLSYYGNAWMALDYGRSTYLWNNGKYTGWRKEFYEVRKAGNYYRQAYELSAANKEFQAAAFFLVAKCAQRQVPRPDFDYDNWEASEKAEKDYQGKFRNNALFPQFKKEFGQTKFYRYVLNRCTYLADFDKR